MISIIIPTYNEALRIGGLVRYLRVQGGALVQEIIVVDGYSNDATVAEAAAAGANVLLCAERGRACQLNLGARMAQGEILYFVHADTLPPENYAQDIIQSISGGCNLGCYRLRLASRSRIVRSITWHSRFSGRNSGGGDQSLFMQAKVFEALGGYDESRCVMEDFELVRRARRHYRFVILNDSILASARKYAHNHLVVVTFANLLAFAMDALGIPNHKIARTYRWLVADAPSYETAIGPIGHSGDGNCNSSYEITSTNR